MTIIFSKRALAMGAGAAALLCAPTASAAGICDFLSGDAAAICRAAKAAKDKAKQKPPAVQGTPSPTTQSSPAPAARSRGRTTPASRAAPPPPANPNIYRSNTFKGISTWNDAFTKMVDDPAGFQAFLTDIVKTASGVDAKVYGLATGPERNFYQKFLTDYRVYGEYFRSPTDLRTKAAQCAAERDYTPAEACDCVAGFPGDTLIGAGAGELVTGSNSALGIRACGKAAEDAADPLLKARYIGQRARAQIYTYDTYQAIQWADEAIRMGYKRAAIVKASAALRDFEVRNTCFPPPSVKDNTEIMTIGSNFLKEAKALRIRETYVVARQYQQALAIFKFNNAVLTPIFKAMTAPLPPDKVGGCRADGVPCAGERYDATGNIVRN